MCDDKVKKWVEFAMKNEDLVDYTVTVHGKTNKDDGYLGTVAFVEVIGKSKAGLKKSYNLVIKSSKESNKFRKRLPIKDIFEKEIYIYDRVKTEFEVYLKEKNVDLLELLPHCYGTQITDTNELLVLENLKSRGYDLWDRKVPLPFDHIKLVLEAYGKWHALSLALKEEKPENFGKLVENNKNMFGYFMLKAGLIDTLLEFFESARDNTNLPKEILEKLQYSRNDMKFICKDLYDEDLANQVILHGDGWTNNFLFEYQNDTKKPLNVRVIDWQLSGLGSPVLDLSYLIYCCCNTEVYQEVDLLLKIYYNSLSESLKLLGYDAQDIFSYGKLLEHWKKNSWYGLILSTFILKFSLCDGDEAPDLAEAAEKGKDFLDCYKFEIRNAESYFKRARNNFIHYINNLE